MWVIKKGGLGWLDVRLFSHYMGGLRIDTPFYFDVIKLRMESLLVQLQKVISSCWNQRMEGEWWRTNQSTLFVK